MAPAASKMLGSPQPKLVGHCLVLAAKKGAGVALKKLLVVGGAWRAKARAEGAPAGACSRDLKCNIARVRGYITFQTA